MRVSVLVESQDQSGMRGQLPPEWWLKHLGLPFLVMKIEDFGQMNFWSKIHSAMNFFFDQNKGKHIEH